MHDNETQTHIESINSKKSSNFLLSNSKQYEIYQTYDNVKMRKNNFRV